MSKAGSNSFPTWEHYLPLYYMHSTPGRGSYSHPTLVSLSLETKPSIFSGISLPPKTLLSHTQFITNIYKANTGLMFSPSLLVGKGEKINVMAGILDSNV